MARYRTNDGKIVEFDVNGMYDLANKGQKIGLIKLLRSVSGLGLRDSKDAIEACQYGVSGEYRKEHLQDTFKKYLIDYPEPYTKEEFMNLVENAVDNMDVYMFPSMVHAVDALLDNIKQRGGLNRIAEERDDYLDAI